jgi:hypothetical protein
MKVRKHFQWKLGIHHNLGILPQLLHFRTSDHHGPAPILSSSANLQPLWNSLQNQITRCQGEARSWVEPSLIYNSKIKANAHQSMQWSQCWMRFTNNCNICFSSKTDKMELMQLPQQRKHRYPWVTTFNLPSLFLNHQNWKASLWIKILITFYLLRPRRTCESVNPSTNIL